MWIWSNAHKTNNTYTFSLSIETLFSFVSRSLARSLSLDRERFLTPLAGDREDPRVRVSAMLTITAYLGNQAGLIMMLWEGSTSCKQAQTGKAGNLSWCLPSGVVSFSGSEIINVHKTKEQREHNKTLFPNPNQNNNGSFVVWKANDSAVRKLNRTRKWRPWGGAGREKKAVRKTIIFCFDLGSAFVRLY